MKRLLTAAVLALCAAPAIAQDKAPRTLFTHVRIFDGVHEALLEDANLLVEGHLIARISTDEIPAEGATVIDGGGRTLMPGLIDMHAHLMHTELPYDVLLEADLIYIAIVQGQAAERMLMRGFTSFRDVGGPTFGLKRAIDEGRIAGPRIWPSGAMLSQTSGHGDYRSRAHDLPGLPGREPHFTESWGWMAIADGRPAVLRATREQLMKGASQIKMMAGGGVASNYDPLDVVQYTEDEMKAAVEAASAWKTYVAVHAYTPEAIRQAIRAGVKSIEHAQLIDEETVRMAVEADVWLSMQPFLDDEDAIPFPEGSENRAKLLQMTRGTDAAYELARKHGARIAWGTDVQFDSGLAARQGKQLAKMTRWFTPFEVLRMATSGNAALLALSGPRSPYREGPVGVIEEGAYADLLLVDGDPLATIDLIAEPERSFDLIMKDGVIHKNALE
ncbi:metal-dependent hydrolase family protein [Albimonas pacifica]|uniref:Imidazolonepropionase n=1 Tax=Albimonas pacifica TaxID=1114924 RepID=A0A1I3DFV5_9RHOB|nr:amidohydrolase family protein [Albimonas pacifica]SFH85605.1 Imidazolonepropionase [Albimonas pacifica]